MKNIMFSAIVMAFVLVSCNQKNKVTKTTPTEESATSSQLYSCSMHPEVTGKKGEKCSKCGMELAELVKVPSEKVSETSAQLVEEVTTDVTQISFSTNAIVSNYLTIKNALTKDDAKSAASAAKVLYATFNEVNAKSIDTKQKKDYLNIADDAKEHAEHIGANADKLEHQREHFEMLSKDINDLIKLFGIKQNLYQDYCPMANDGKGAIWISEVKEIKNPYMGSKMFTCGSVKKTY